MGIGLTVTDIFPNVIRRVQLFFFICRPSLFWRHLHPNLIMLKENKRERKTKEKTLKKTKKTKMMTLGGKRTKTQNKTKEVNNLIL